MMTQIKHLLLLGVAVILFACSSSTSVVPDNSSTKAAENEADIQKYLSTNNLAAKKTTSGVYYVVTKANPTGKSVAIGEQMAFHYVASLLSGVKFDSTSIISNKPAKLTYGVAYNSPGAAVVEVIGALHEGEKATILVPSTLGYGSNSSSLIPAYSVLKYDVAVLGFYSEIQQIKNYVLASNLKITDTTATGLRYIKNAEGTGDPVKTGQTVTVNYTGKKLDDTQFDTGTFSFTIGSGGVIPGFNEGVAKMKIGEKATIIFPSAIGYGKSGSGSTIAPYSPLRFDIELVK